MHIFKIPVGTDLQKNLKEFCFLIVCFYETEKSPKGVDKWSIKCMPDSGMWVSDGGRMQNVFNLLKKYYG